MMTDLTQGPTGTDLSDGSHRILGQPSNVHEELGYRAFANPTGYKVMTVEPTRIAPVPGVLLQHAAYRQSRNFTSKRINHAS